MSDTQLWQVNRRDDIVIAVYENPPINYYTDAAVQELALLVDSWSDPTIRAVILAGPGEGPFITHFSPDEILSGVRNSDAIINSGPVRNNAVNRTFTALTQLPVPVIAAMNGDTMGFGLELALVCDIRIGQRDSNLRYGFPEVRLGVIPGSGGSQRLTRLCGLATALDVVLRSRIFSPQEARDMGVITELADDAVERALEMAQEIVNLPQLAVALAKRELREGEEAPLASALAIESDASVRSKLGPDTRGILEAYTSMPVEHRRAWLEGQ